MPKNKLRRVLARLPLIFFGVLVSLICCEVALRLLGYSFPEFYQIDNSRGYSLRPSMEGWYRKEGEAFVRINRDGLRDRDHARTKPAETFRIAVLGDSYAEALQVSQEQAFWSVLERQLQACESLVQAEKTVAPQHSGEPASARAKTVEVINFGVSGYSTAQELITLREQVWAYSPDLVLLTVTTNNDISDNSRDLKKTDEVPYFILQNSQLVLDDSFKDSRSFRLRQSFVNRFGRWIKDHSRVIQATIEGHRGFKVRLAAFRQRWRKTEAPPPESAGTTEPKLQNEEVGIDNLIYVESTNPTWANAWEVTEKLIEEIHNEVKAHGSQMILVTLSNPPQVMPNPEARQLFLKRVGARDLFYPDNRIRNLAMREGIEVITLALEMQAYADRQKVFLHGFGVNSGNGHWNAEGHRLAGELIARKLCENSRSAER
jgi:hypothetical protein